MILIRIANQLLKLPIWHYSFYHIFLAIEEQKEVNTDYILNILSGKDKNIVVSKSDFSTGLMTHFLLTDSTKIKKNKLNIPEPIDGIEISKDKIDVVFIPLLAFDKNKTETIKIGLSFFEAETEIENVFKSDVRLDYCVTPIQVYQY